MEVQSRPLPVKAARGYRGPTLHLADLEVLAPESPFRASCFMHWLYRKPTGTRAMADETIAGPFEVSGLAGKRGIRNVTSGCVTFSTQRCSAVLLSAGMASRPAVQPPLRHVGSDPGAG